MSIYARILSTLAMVATVVGPVSAATTQGAPTHVAQASSMTPGAVSGTVNDAGGAPVPGATITFRGPVTQQTTSDATGAFQIASINPGLYTVTAEKAGYQTASNSVAIFAGQTEKVAITMPTASFSSLRTIATVRSAGRGTFNTSAASVNTVSTQTFIDQGSTGVGAVLNQVPGLQVSLPNNDGNGAAPGAIVFANIRNSLSFETATLIDGHPLSVGKYGDYVLSFWTPFVFQGAEVVKGPGADATQTNYAIGGTLNLRTLDPTQKVTPTLLFGQTSTGGTFFNAGISGTTGRLGFVADVASLYDPSVINGQNEYIGQENGGVAHINGTTDVLSYNNTLSPIPGTNDTAANYNNYQLLICCYQTNAWISKLNELVKLKYKFSNATTATVSYLGGQAQADQNGNTSQLVPSTFQPGAGYTGPIPVGANYLIGNSYPGGDIETNNEPMFQMELATTLGNDTILARYFHASIYRLLNEGNSNYTIPNSGMYTLNGNNQYGYTYNNLNTQVDFYNYFVQNEIDKLGGYDFQYQHPYGAGNTVTFSASQTISQTAYWYQETGINYNNDNSFAGAYLDEPDVTIPEGSSETFTTFRLTGNQNFGDKFNALLSLYDNHYSFTAASACGAGASSTAANACAISGSNATFVTNDTSHFDERLGLTYRPSPDLIFRGSMGSSIAPPYIGLLSKFSSLPSCSSAITCPPVITVSQTNPNLVPETSFGYDIGADYRLKNSYYVSGDIYLTNLFNQFISTTVDSGLTCTSGAYPTSNCPATNGPPIYYNINGNVNNSRYEGIELSIRHVVSNGFGFIVQGSTQRGYAYNLGSNFYCSFASTAAEPCIPANYNQNLAVVANQNFNGGSYMYFHSGYCSNQTNQASSEYWCATGDNVSNQSVPYLQGYAEINWQNPAGWYASFGGTLFGKNNSYNEPPFTVARIALRAPIGDDFALQISGYNIFNAYKQLFPIVSGGVAIPLANGAIGPTNGNVIGPAQWNFVLSKKFGGTP